jgi:cyanate permease
VTDRTPLRYALLGLGSLAYTCLMFVWFSVAAFLTEIVAALSLSPTQAGLLTGAVPLTYVPVALFAGYLTDRIGPYRAIGGGMLLFGGAQVGRAGATGFPAMLALTVVVGLGATTITFGLPKLVSELFPTDEAGLPSSIYVLGSFAGIAAAFSIGKGVLGPLLGGWRPVFSLSGLVVLGYAVLWLVVVRLAPLDALRVADAEAAAAAADGDGEAGAATVTGLASLRRNLGFVFGSRGMRLLVVVGVVYLLVVHGLQNWLATVLEARGTGATLAATVTTGFVAAEAVGTLAVPPLSDRLGDRGGVVAACGGVCALGMTALAVPGVPFAGAVLGALVVGVGVGGLSPLVRLIPAELEDVGPARTGTAVGLVFAVGELGGFLGPFLIGSLFGLSGSYAPGLAVLAVGCLAAVVAGWRLPV